MGHPSLGSGGQHFVGRSHLTLPSSVTINGGVGAGAGFFPPSLSPVPITNPEAGLQNSRPDVSPDAFKKRIALMNEFDT